MDTLAMATELVLTTDTDVLMATRSISMAMMNMATRDITPATATECRFYHIDGVDSPFFQVYLRS